MFDESEQLPYNRRCPAHVEHTWSNRHMMRQDNQVCTACYKKLPDYMKKQLWKMKDDWKPSDRSILSGIVDWLLEHNEEKEDSIEIMKRDANPKDFDF